MASVGIPDLVEDTASASSLPPVTSSRKSWQEIRMSVKSSHRVASSLFHRTPQSFTFRTVDTPLGTQQRLYFLGVPNGNRDNTLLFADLGHHAQGQENGLLQVRTVLDSFQPSAVAYGQLSKEEQLLRERKRLRSFGITSFDFVTDTGQFAFPVNSNLYVCKDALENGLLSSEPVLPSEVRTSSSSGCLDAKLSPNNTNLLAFVSANDIWVANIEAAQDRRLTFAHEGYSGQSIADDPKSAGVPSFIMQEEFDRYTGYWWQPPVLPQAGKKPVYRILYEEVDESDVEILSIVSPQGAGQSVDEYRYPRAGTPNARSSLRLLEFELEDNGAICNVTDKPLSQPLAHCFPSMEYILRAGWTPDGKYVYAELTDRLQKRLQLILIPLPCFSSAATTPASDGTTHASPDSAKIHVLYEDSTDIWLHVHDLLHFFPQSNPGEMSFVFASEKSGFLHLYHITSSLHGPASSTSYDSAVDLPEDTGVVPAHVIQEVQLTQGEWEVDSKQIWVNEERQVVLFMAYKDTPLQTHLYAVSLQHPGREVRLTPEGFSHAVNVDKECQTFVTVYSNVNEAPACSVHRLQYTTDNRIESHCIGTILKPSVVEEYVAPELFSYPGADGNFTMHGMVYKPHHMVEGRTYPTVLFVYGGPHVQLVSDAYKGIRFLRLHTLASLGYVVVVIDSRGSCHRGHKFEGHIQDKLGQVEVSDQVEGLQWLASQVNYIDLNRVAIHGWSYGGYVALMGLAQRPDIFKIAIAGAPVTCWRLYDTGYTERYMGLPHSNQEGYRLGSVLEQVHKLPSEENRLLIIHGMIDENVHFYHTSSLVSALVKACKPYQLQVYPAERHGIRNPEANEHYETMLISFLVQNL